MRAILNSFHSTSASYIAEDEPEVIISFDSHLDTYLSTGFDGTLFTLINKLPDLYKWIILRASAHVLIHQMNPYADYYIVIPELCYYMELKHHAFPVLKSINNEDLRAMDTFMKMFLSKLIDATLVLSPPSNLVDEFKNLRELNVVIDIDVDYMAEFQNECYTPGVLDPSQLDKLGTAQTVFELINELQPSLITISEFTLKALRNRKSKLREFIQRLKDAGYRISYGYLSPSDKKARKIMKEYIEFTISAHSMIANLLKDRVEELSIEEQMYIIDKVFLDAFLSKYGHLIKVDKI